MTTDPVDLQRRRQLDARIWQVTGMRQRLLEAYNAKEYEGDMDRLAENVLYVLSVLPGPLASDHAARVIKELHRRKLHPSVFRTTWNVLRWLRDQEFAAARSYRAQLARSA
jgi:hypothetical protein